MSEIPLIVIAGGPGAGKSGVLVSIKRAFRGEVIFVPEVATFLIKTLRLKPPFRGNDLRVWQRAVAEVQAAKESLAVLEAARQGHRGVVLDRGRCDGAGYLDGGWEEFGELIGSQPDLEFVRYDHVVFLEMPPEDIWRANHGNNATRKEDWPEAEELGRRLRVAWQDHPSFHAVPFQPDFGARRRNVLHLVRSMLSGGSDGSGR